MSFQFQIICIERKKNANKTSGAQRNIEGKKQYFLSSIPVKTNKLYIAYPRLRLHITKVSVSCSKDISKYASRNRTNLFLLTEKKKKDMTSVGGLFQYEWGKLNCSLKRRPCV